MTLTLGFEDGTLRVESDHESDPAPDSLPGVERDPRSETARAPAHHYAAIRDVLRRVDADVDDTVLGTEPVSLATSYELREYQQDALDTWLDSNCRGVLELPTGAGKTVIALAAMAAREESTLVVVPTIDLLEQWQRELETEFEAPVGRLGGGEQRVEAVTVATYDSAYLRADELGDRFGLVVFDEVHHLGAEGYQDIARLLAAPDRLGLTATFERPDGAHETVADLVGSRVYSIDTDDLAGDHLAPYEIRRIEVELTPAERASTTTHREPSSTTSEARTSLFPAAATTSSWSNAPATTRRPARPYSPNNGPARS
ncbi:MAG: DNA or RNA helicase of superfamily II [Halonotius sp. J07HN4]|nr:MAG: DNA or RNA helicase of superfamily II [Halonotius sp. J07HN4]